MQLSHSASKVFDQDNDKVHPYDKCGPFSLIFFQWCSGFITQTSREEGFIQDDHPNNPFKEGSYQSFLALHQYTKQGMTLGSAIFRAFYSRFIRVFFLTLVNVALSTGSLLVMYLLTAEFENEIGHSKEGRVDDKNNCLYLVSALMLLSISKCFLVELTGFENEKIERALTMSLNGSVFNKLMRISIMNSSDMDEGKLNNHSQIDAEFESFMWALNTILDNFTNLFIISGIGVFIFGSVFLYLIGFLAVVAIPMSLIMKGWFGVFGVWLANKDKRINFWKNIYTNIKYFKIRGWENLILEKLSTRRNTEMWTMLQNGFFLCMFLFVSFIGPPLCIVGFLHFYFEGGNSLDVASVAIFIRVITILSNIVSSLPYSFSNLNDRLVGLSRLNKFMASKELNSHLAQTKDILFGEENSVEIKDGNFEWEKKADGTSTPEAQKKSQEKRKGQKVIEASLLADDEAITSDKFSLKIGKFVAPKGKITLIIGKIGSGKSSLLYSILGEMTVADIRKTKVRVDGVCHFVGQKPWILNSTLKENIILNKPYSKERMDWALKYSGMEADLKNFPEGIHHETGEGGDALSGGQRARLSLCQALYQDPDVYILDDVLSALDAYVGAFIMEETILKQLKNKTVILSTHAIQYLKYGHYIYMMDDGMIKAEGPFESIVSCEIYRRYEEINASFQEKQQENVVAEEKVAEERRQTRIASNMIQRRITEKIGAIRPSALNIANLNEHNFAKEQPHDNQHEEIKDDKIEDVLSQLIIPEDQERGGVSFQTYVTFYRQIGGIFVILLPLSFTTLVLFLQMYSFFLLSDWGEHFELYDRDEYFKKFIFYSLAGSWMASVRGLIVTFACYFLSRSIHAKMAYAILHSRVEEFISRVPTGRVMNRFTNDMQTIDFNLTLNFSFLCFKIGEILVIMSTLWLVLGGETVVCLVILIVVCVYYQRVFMGAKREFLRLDSVSRTPVLAALGDSAKGLTNIRSNGTQNYFFRKFLLALNEQCKNKIVITGLNHWYNIRAGLAPIFLILIPTYILIIFINKGMKASEVSIIVFIGVNLSTALNELLLEWANFESTMVSLERCSAFEKLQPEDQYTTYAEDFKKVTGSKTSVELLRQSQLQSTQQIITHGCIQFKNMSAKYDINPKPVISNLTITIKPGEKVGVIGRTGSGKSSLIKLIWRSLDYFGGDILIDGVDIKRCDLKSLRSQMTIISQETALIEGTLRENIDLRSVDSSKDVEMEAILRRLGFNNQIYMKESLDMAIDGDGANLSAGERQLVSFARTVLEKKPIMILDEATASIDLKTEEVIQNCLETEFKNSTMLIIAHRIQTIMFCDKILILEQGRAVAFESPADLKKNKNGYFMTILDKMKEK